MNDIKQNGVELSPEFRLIAACSWLPQNRMSQFAQIDDIVASGINWAEATSLVLRHDLVGCFCHIMGQLDWVNVPIASRDLLKAVRRQQAVRAIAQAAELCRVGKIFVESGIQLIPLKGVALSQELYGEPSVRSSGDIDVLVRVEDVAKAEKLLVRLGYRNALEFHNLSRKQQIHFVRSEHHHEYVNDERGVHIELHWRSYLWTDAQVNLLWDGSIPSKWVVGGKHLSKVDNILFLADHGARHGWQSLKWLSDLAMLMEKCSADEWDTIYDRASFFDLHRIILESALLLSWCFGIEPTPRAKVLIASDKIVSNLAYDTFKQLTASSAKRGARSRHFIGLKLAFRLKQLKPDTSVSVLLQSLFIIHSDYREFPLPDKLFWLYLPLRPLFWIKRHFLHKM